MEFILVLAVAFLGFFFVGAPLFFMVIWRRSVGRQRREGVIELGVNALTDLARLSTKPLHRRDPRAIIGYPRGAVFRIPSWDLRTFFSTIGIVLFPPIVWFRFFSVPAAFTRYTLLVEGSTLRLVRGLHRALVATIDLSQPFDVIDAYDVRIKNFAFLHGTSTHPYGAFYTTILMQGTNAIALVDSGYLNGANLPSFPSHAPYAAAHVHPPVQHPALVQKLKTCQTAYQLRIISSKQEDQLMKILKDAYARHGVNRTHSYVVARKKKKPSQPRSWLSRQIDRFFHFLFYILSGEWIP